MSVERWRPELNCPNMCRYYANDILFAIFVWQQRQVSGEIRVTYDEIKWLLSPRSKITIG